MPLKEPAMRQILAIFRKDARRLRLPVAAVWGLTALAGWADSQTSALASTSGVPDGVWALCWIYLTAAVIQQERLPGDCQYWLCRPYDWRCLLAAKALFVVVFAALPMAAAKAAALAVNGISPFSHLATVLSTVLLFTASVALIAAVLASVTASMLQFLWILLGAGALAAAAAFAGHGTAPLSLIVTAMAPVLLFQYRRRRTLLSRGILSGLALLMVAVPFENAWPESPGPVALSFDRSARTRIRFADAPYFPKAGLEGFYLPIRVDGLPSGAAVVSRRVALTIDAGEGRRWTSGWSTDGAVTAIDPLDDRRLLYANGAAWQYVNIDRAFYQPLKDTPVRIHVTADLVLLGGAQHAAIAGDGRTTRLPREGICEVRPLAIPLPGGLRGVAGIRNLGVFCAWPRPGPELAYVRGGPSASRSLLASSMDMLAGFDPSVWQRGAVVIPVHEAQPRFSVETWNAEARIERSFDIAGVRLSGYVVPRVTDPE
jgi:hypothetical protein